MGTTMADERNFRQSYYEKVGFKSVEEKRSLEILLKERKLDISKLRQFSLRFSIPVSHRNFVWKVLLGISLISSYFSCVATLFKRQNSKDVLGIHESCHEYVFQQRTEEYENLLRACNWMRIIDNIPKYQVFVALWLLRKNRLKIGYNDYEAEKEFVAIVKTMMNLFESDVDIFWMASCFYDVVTKFEYEIPKLIESTISFLEKEEPELFKKFERNGVLTKLPIKQWFESCFAGVISDISLPKIWDKICGGSQKILIYVTVVVLTSLQHKLIKCESLEDILECTNNLSDEMSDVIVNKSIELWQKHGNALSVYDKAKT